MGNRKRTHGINIRVTEEEKRLIERCAMHCQLSISEYLRKLACGKPAEASEGGTMNHEKQN